MSNFIIEEFTTYKIFLYNNISEQNANCGIQIKLNSGIAYLHFMRSNLPNNQIISKGNFNDYHCYVSLDKFAHYVDILRNEKPLYFYYKHNDNLSYVTTSDEPVGEEESKHED